ncbi:MAG: serine phosphatase rsbU, regulator of sigma subunit [Frankiales bacterium]|nr:serine phosphatase rsbU, regulator of sigma subunit [Frankiales bacterium]
MLLSQEVTEGVEVLAVVGPVTDPDAAALQRAVTRAVALQPRGVVIDLADAGELAPAAVDVLNWASARAAGWPRPTLAVCAPPDGLADLVLPQVTLHADRAQALAHVDDRTERHVCARTTVTDGPEGASQARRLAQQCAAEGGFEGEDLALVVTELVTNALRHGLPPVEVEIDTCVHCVTVVVADASSARPRPREAAETDEGGRGLLLVDLLAADSGSRPQPPGKVVWAELPRTPVS